MSLYGMPWRLRVSPTPALLNETLVPLPQVVLGMGCLLATLLAVMLRLAQTARLRTRQVEFANQGLQNEIAERKQVEADLKTLNMTLEQRVAERTAAVEARSQALARSNADLEQFAYVASHDLQEPLRMITGYLQLLERRYKEQLGADADTFIAYVVDGATRMQRLIQDLLVYARVEIQGKSFAPIHCEEILARARTNLHVAIAENGAVITHTSLPVVMADDGQLTQLFQNLLSNALKFCEAKPPRIHIAAERPGAAWVFAVRDNGLGIEPQYAERIFVIFQRLHGRAAYPGTGIGLAICKKIVERPPVLGGSHSQWCNNPSPEEEKPWGYSC
jgi:light-regulated signal transduction histidine kinase (bacteriophytochrome)